MMGRNNPTKSVSSDSLVDHAGTVQAENVTDVGELDHIEAPLTNFVSGNELLMLAQLDRQLTLRPVAGFALLD